MSWKETNTGPREQASTVNGRTSPGKTPTEGLDVLSTRARRRQAARIVKRRKRTNEGNERGSDRGGGE